MPDFALRPGFEVQLCQLHRAETKGKVEGRGNHLDAARWTT